MYNWNVFCDGSYHPDSNVGGYAFTITGDFLTVKIIVSSAGVYLNSIDAEMAGAIEALVYIRRMIRNQIAGYGGSEDLNGYPTAEAFDPKQYGRFSDSQHLVTIHCDNLDVVNTINLAVTHIEDEYVTASMLRLLSLVRLKTTSNDDVVVTATYVPAHTRGTDHNSIRQDEVDALAKRASATLFKLQGEDYDDCDDS